MKYIFYSCYNVDLILIKMIFDIILVFVCFHVCVCV